jgi:putative tryptophan/tyrosine transport system substrate-binding protein
MTQKILISLLVTVLLTTTPPAEAQQQKKIARIGYLSERPAAQEKILMPAFLQALRELGYTEGKNLVIEQRHIEAGQSERLRGLAAELVRLKVDVIVASGGAEAEAAKQTTTMIPIVFTVHADPVGTGLVDSLARPGGNVTGLSDFHGDLSPNGLSLLRRYPLRPRTSPSFGIRPAPRARPNSSSSRPLPPHWALRSCPSRLKDLMTSSGPLPQ